MAASDSRSGLFAENAEELSGGEGGAEVSEGNEDEGNEEESDDEDYVPPGGISLDLEATDVRLRSPVGVSASGVTHSEGFPVNADVIEGRGSIQSTGNEVIDVAEDSDSEPQKASKRGLQNAKDEENCPESSFLWDPDLLLPNCPICMERWTGQGVHRVCCIPCGHLYGRSCLEHWVKRCGESFARCPQCKKRFKVKEIINLYAPQVAVLNDELEKELGILRQKNESLEVERKKLLDEVIKLKKDAEEHTQSKKACIRHVFPGALQMSASEFFNESPISPLQGSSFLPNTGQDSHLSDIVLQDELQCDGVRVLDIDALSQVVLISGKAPGWRIGHSLIKISLLSPNAVQSIALSEDTGVVRDLRFSPVDVVLPGRLALLASLGKKLSVFSMETNNIVLTYSLPGPAWSCSWDSNSPHHIYAGLQNGMLLTFDIRQTSSPLESKPGLSAHPVHTIHSLPRGGTGSLLTASAMGPCLWDVNETSPQLLPEMENHGVCISLAYGSNAAEAVATYRPRVQPAGAATGSQVSQGHVRLGTHVVLKRINSNGFCRHAAACGNVSDVRMCRSAVISSENGGAAFVYPDEAAHCLCVWKLATFQVGQRLKPHESPILDVRFSKPNFGPGLLGCISESKVQFFRVRQ